MAIVNNIHNKTPQLVPKPTPEDNGKFLRVSNGNYALESVPTAEGAEF